MNISYNWLRRYISLPDDASTVAGILTSIGLETGKVERVQSVRGGLEGLVVGEVLTCIAHPNSDHLHITTVRLQEGEAPVQIVCGAPNVAAGQKVIVATVGTTLYDGDQEFKIKRSKIRGEESLGMICAEDEIGIGTSHDGIIVLPQDTPVGTPAKDYYQLEDDYVLEVDIIPNRADALSHYGVARDLFAYYSVHQKEKNILLTKPSVEAFATDNSDYIVDVEVADEVSCPRYCGVTIAGVTVGPSPEWLQKHLSAIGLRSINNVVDATNFVLHEMGQALHAFDADKIAGKKIIVRKAHEGEKFITLDGVERTLCSDDLMICNANEPMCMAGVFGGLSSGVTESTTNVFLESAYFNPITIRKTARHHQLSTDASYRYERGCDPCNTLYVLKRCAMLIQEVAGGKIAMPIVDKCPQKEVLTAPFHVLFSLENANKLIGKTLTCDEVETIFNALEIAFQRDENADYQLFIPKYRVDVQRECDVVEDILRIYGYNNVPMPTQMLSSVVHAPQPDSFALQRRLSNQLSNQGFNEIMNNSLTKESYYIDNQSDIVRVLNPLSQDLSVLRQTLLFGGLESISRNANRQSPDLKLYEFGNCYSFTPNGDGLHAYAESMQLGLWLTGFQSQPTWLHKQEKTSFYHLHAYVNATLERLGIDISKVQEYALDASEKYLADGLRLEYNKTILGTLGIVRSELLEIFDIHDAVYFAQLDWNALLRVLRKKEIEVRDIPKYPFVRRDFALLVDTSVRFAELRNVAFETERKLLKDVYLFDVFEGKGIIPGKKSYALSFVLQDAESTLKDGQIEAVMNKLKKAFEDKFGALLR